MPPKPNPADRDGKRYIFQMPVPASMGNSAVLLVNASDRGLQIAHAQMLRTSTVCRISVAFPGSSHHVELEGQIVWTQLSMVGEGKGVYTYLSGVRLDGTAENAALIAMIVAAYPGGYDDGGREKRGEPIMRIVKTPQKAVDGDRLLLIRQVNERLSLAPEEQKVLAGRARSALSIRVASVTQSDHELAVWEYLQHVISLDDIHDALS